MKNKITYKPKTLTNMQNYQPTPMLSQLLNAITWNLTNALNKANAQDPTANVTMQCLCQQILEANDNSGCLNLAITFNAPNSDEQGLAGDFALIAHDIAIKAIQSQANQLSQYNSGSLTQTNKITDYATNINNTFDDFGLTYYNALVTVTDGTLYIHCTYNQQ